MNWQLLASFGSREEYVDASLGDIETYLTIKYLWGHDVYDVQWSIYVGWRLIFEDEVECHKSEIFNSKSSVEDKIRTAVICAIWWKINEANNRWI